MSPRPIGGKRRSLVAAAALAALASVVFTSGPASAAPTGTLAAPDYAGLRQALQNVVAAGSPGAFATVSDRGGPGGTVGVGTGDTAAQTPVDPQGQFRIGSITKNFVAVLVLQLAAQQQVDLDAPAAGYLPSGVLPADSPITVRQLLNHTSGLYDYSNDLPGILVGDTVTGYQQFRYATYAPADLVADALTHGSQFTPGSQYQYSNTNFVVLGMLVEQVTGKPFAQDLQERILGPVGMPHTRFIVPRTDLGGPHATGYLTQDDRSKPLFDATAQTASWIWTAGAAISSSADLNKYWRALTAGKLLPPAQLAQMESMVPVDSTGASFYGLGMRAYTLSCGTQVYGHDGIVQGYQTYSYTTKDGSRQLTVSANASNNGDVFAAERTALDPVFCGSAPTPSAARLASADSAHIAAEETTGVSPEPLRR
ncbi:D-alanyl-D-alanine carboxypeptidase [Streptomyces sp. DvalAA-14]|uniref:serine hydrolase domain-containing protein n=1 Tax=unclassified Streptomyces TaxID=2593676 RepID=UPI00081B3C9E|nr:serine hydrolase domain-containing protein [Streptomyces sp. DvalAA-14]MYS20941.1 serine hydrolase [Streptomyces sp. SID4948]SCD80439.1 D-alanyl-D-alanine carboxypeptidase [Streptomyces sp. DvalAA-14]